jgi:hypothetical protein
MSRGVDEGAGQPRLAGQVMDALEMTARSGGLNHLMQCRGGDFVVLAANYEGGAPLASSRQLMSGAGS